MAPWNIEYFKLLELKKKNKNPNDGSRKVTLTPTTLILLP